VGSARALELAAALEAANLELIQLVRGCSDEQWRELANDEGDGRTVGVIAHHVAHGHLDTIEWMETALEGRAIEVTLADQAEVNARHAKTYHDVARDLTAGLLEANGRLLKERVERLSDDELAQTGHHAGAGRDMTVEAFADLGRRHVTGHLATIKKALDLG
jgi:regulator of RNase E activity RraB